MLEKNIKFNYNSWRKGRPRVLRRPKGPSCIFEEDGMDTIRGRAAQPCHTKNRGSYGRGFSRTALLEHSIASQLSSKVHLEEKTKEGKLCVSDIMRCLKTQRKRFLRDPHIHKHADKADCAS